MLLILSLLAACGDVGITQTGTAVCDGETQTGELTVDAPFDADGDGYFDGLNPDCQDNYPEESLDCDDDDPDVNPGAEEICDDGIDNDCDGEVDCLDLTGNWVVVPSVSYACALNSVTISVSSFTITDTGSVLSIAASGGTQPGSMSGEWTGADTFSVANEISSGGAGCDELYTFTGTATSDTITGTLTAQYTPNGTFACVDCTDQSWSITASR